MPKFRKKPVVIEAVQFTGNNRGEVLRFICSDLSEEALLGAEKMMLPVVIETLEGNMSASVGDWIIKGIKNEFYPCKPDIFDATEEVADILHMEDQMPSTMQRLAEWLQASHYRELSIGLMPPGEEVCVELMDIGPDDHWAPKRVLLPSSKTLDLEAVIASLLDEE